jgi:uncharacterized protein with HEPN domain
MPFRSMSGPDRVRLQHMMDAAREAIEFASGRTAEDLATDRVRALALVRCIEIIGEAASRVEAASRLTITDLPWPDIIGMRNRLIHAYFDVDLALVCETIQTHLSFSD